MCVHYDSPGPLGEVLEVFPGRPTSYVTELMSPAKFLQAPFGIKLRIDGKNKIIANARWETVQIKKTFAQSYRDARILIPLLKFYEWVGEAGAKREIAITPSAPLWAAGILVDACAVMMTRPPFTAISRAGHQRSPMLMTDALASDWLSSGRPYLDEPARFDLEIKPA